LEWQGEEAVQLLKQIGRRLAGAVAICAGAQQRDVVERAVLDLKMSRLRVFGTAPEALASAARAIVALALNGSPQEISLALLGVPPHHIVIPWEDATAGGLALTRLVDEPTRRRLSARVAALWPPGPHTLAAAAWLALEAMAGRSRRTISAFAAPDATAGLRARTSALPVRVGRSGIVEVIAPRLNAVDRVAFDNATLL
jgi:malate/lactate dehydrogenase